MFHKLDGNCNLNCIKSQAYKSYAILYPILFLYTYLTTKINKFKSLYNTDSLANLVPLVIFNNSTQYDNPIPKYIVELSIG